MLAGILVAVAAGSGCLLIDGLDGSESSDGAIEDYDSGARAVDAGRVVADDAEAHRSDGGLCVQPTFTDIQAKIIRDTRCSICHNNPGFGGLQMPAEQAVSYAAVMGNTVGGLPAKRVVPGNPDQSTFYLKLTANPPFPSRMPTGGALRDCEIAAVRQWIMNGAAND